MENGLCLFCDELDSPDHYQLKHKRSQIFLIECDVDLVSDDKELVSVALNQAKDQCKNVVEEKSTPPLRKNIKHLEGKHSHKVYSEFRSRVDFSLPQEYQEDSMMLIKSSNNVKLPFSQEYSRSSKSTFSFSEMVLPISVRDCTIEKRFTCFSRADRVWEPGGFPAKRDLWNLRENRNHDDMLELTLQLHGKGLQRNKSKDMMNVSPQLYRLAVRSDVVVETWLETYGWEYKKCTSPFVNQGSKVEELSLLKVLRGSEMYGSCRDFEWFFRNGGNETMEETKTMRECSYYKSILEEHVEREINNHKGMSSRSSKYEDCSLLELIFCAFDCKTNIMELVVVGKQWQINQGHVSLNVMSKGLGYAKQEKLIEGDRVTAICSIVMLKLELAQETLLIPAKDVGVFFSLEEKIVNLRNWSKHKKGSSSIWHRWRNKDCRSGVLVKAEKLRMQLILKSGLHILPQADSKMTYVVVAVSKAEVDKKDKRNKGS